MTDENQRRIRFLSWLFAFSLIAGSIVFVLTSRNSAFVVGPDRVRLLGTIHIASWEVVGYEFEVPKSIGFILGDFMHLGVWFLISLGIFGGLLVFSACLKRLFSRRAEISS